MLLWLRAVQTTLFWTVGTVLFRTNQRKPQVASAALDLGALVWKLRKSPRENRTTGITKDQRAEKRKRRSKLNIKDASTDRLDALSEFMPDRTDSDAKILALRMYYLEFKLRTK